MLTGWSELRIKPWSVNKTAWFPSGKPWPIWVAPGEGDPRRHAPGVAPLHPGRSSEPACWGQRSGRRSRLHGADDGAVQLAPHQPRRPEQVCPTQRTLHLGHERGRSSQAPLRELAAPDPGLGVSREAVRTQSRVLVLGRSLSEFMRALGVYDSSGRTQTRLRNQMKRLFGCSVSLIYAWGPP